MELSQRGPHKDAIIMLFGPSNHKPGILFIDKVTSHVYFVKTKQRVNELRYSLVQVL